MVIDPLKDIRPHTIAAILEFVYSSAYDIWKERESEATYYDVLDDVFLLLKRG
jgi:hypothetical protein